MEVYLLKSYLPFSYPHSTSPSTLILSSDEIARWRERGIGFSAPEELCDMARVVEYPASICPLDDQYRRVIVLGSSCKDQVEGEKRLEEEKVLIGVVRVVGGTIGEDFEVGNEEERGEEGEEGEDEAEIDEDMTRLEFASDCCKGTYVDFDNGVIQPVLPTQIFSFDTGCLWRPNRKKNWGVLFLSLNIRMIGFSIMQDNGSQAAFTPPMFIPGLKILQDKGHPITRKLYIIKSHLVAVTNYNQIATIDLNSIRATNTGFISEVALKDLGPKQALDVSYSAPYLYVLTRKEILCMRQNIHKRSLNKIITAQQTLSVMGGKNKKVDYLMCSSAKFVYIANSSVICLLKAGNLTLACTTDVKNVLSSTHSIYFMKLLPITFKKRELLVALSYYGRMYLLAPVCCSSGSVSLHNLAQLHHYRLSFSGECFDCKYNQHKEQVLIAGQPSILHTINIIFKS